MPRPPRVAFVNGGILGLSSYAEWLRHAITPAELDATFIVLTEHLTLAERVRRRLICQRLWPDPPGLANVDLGRFRQEWHAGVQARSRLRAAGESGFDVLHFHRQATAYASLDLMARIPSIVSIDCTQSCLLDDASMIERWTLAPNVRRDGQVFRRAAVIVSASQWTADDLARRYPDCRTPVIVMQNPVRFEAFDEQWADARLARAAESGKPRFLFIGGDFPRKGGYDLLNAWVDGDFHDRAVLTLVTDWPLPELPPGVVVRRGVRGYTQEWIEAWRDADVFVMPTRNEAFGLVYQEAAAAGIPAIGTRLNAVPEIVTDGVTGVLVPSRDRGALVGAMRTLIESAELRARMGRAARQHVRAVADPVAHKARLLEWIGRLAHVQGMP